MKRLRTLTGLLAICGMTAFLTGCGDDDDNGGGSNTTAGNAPATLRAQNFNLVSGDTTTIAFAASDNSYMITKPGGSTEAGTYTAVRSGDTWDVTATDSAGLVSRVLLTFTADGVGSYSYTPAGASSATTGSFQRIASSTTSGETTTGQTTTGQTTTGQTTTGQTTTGETTTGETTTGQTTTGQTTTGQTTTGETTTGQTTTGQTTTGQTTTGETTTGQTTTGQTTTGETTTGQTTTGQTTTGQTTTGQTTTGGTTGQAPAALSTITIHADATSVSGVSDYTVTFVGTGSGTFTAGADLFGNYTYTPSGTTAHLRLNYQGQFNGDFDDMTLDFSNGTLNGTQRYNSQDGGIHGTFSNAQ